MTFSLVPETLRFYWFRCFHRLFLRAKTIDRHSVLKRFTGPT